MVSLQGNQGREPEVPVSKLVDLISQEGDEPIVEFLKSELKKGVNPIRKALAKTILPELAKAGEKKPGAQGHDASTSGLIDRINAMRARMK